jgi:hypothetical protein
VADLTVQSITEAGLAPSTSSAAGGGDTFTNDSSERTFLQVTNGSGSSITVTITPTNASRSVPGFGTMTKANGGGTVANGATKLFGPFPSASYNNASDKVSVSYSGVTSVTVAALKLPAASA